ncbi:MAG: glycosyltransferase family 4 protein [Acutalibacteraceae bacterium]|nr:glycosyltransferase family 4 protein [Acutalibacteraceae bacterium]
MKVLFLTNVPSPYRVDFFNELGKSCELTVLFEKSTSDERDASWKNYNFQNFKGIFLKGKAYKTDGAFCLEVIKYLKRGAYDHIVCSNFSSPTGMLAIEFMRLKGIRYFLESDGGFPKDGKGIKEAVKRHFIKGAKGYFSTGATHDGYYLAYGAKKERILRYPFTSLKAEDVLLKTPSEDEKLTLRKELGMTEKNIVISVGRFIECKAFDILIKSAKSFPENTGVYIIGGVPPKEYTDLAKGMNNIHFVDFKQKEELKKYYKAADIFTLLTRGDVWGLVINEAMSMGLPVVTTDKCIAGLELIKDDFNGYIIPVDNTKAVAEKITHIINSGSSEALGKNALDTILEYTFAGMAKAHLDIFRRG